VSIEHPPGSLVVRVEGNGRGWWRRLWGGGSVRHQVVLTVPRRVELLTKGVNGPVRVGAVEGSVEVVGVNGRVELEQADGYQISGVNGGVKLGVARPATRGVEVRGVNGNVNVRLRGSLDADVEVKGNNGNVTFDVANLTMQEREGRASMRARLGAGGTPVQIKGVNGNVHFESTERPTTPAATASAPDALAPPPPPPAPKSF
jgi:DUF4097 and DUF4098 domain-containing protein YvlB